MFSVKIYSVLFFMSLSKLVSCFHFFQDISAIFTTHVDMFAQSPVSVSKFGQSDSIFVVHCTILNVFIAIDRKKTIYGVYFAFQTIQVQIHKDLERVSRARGGPVETRTSARPHSRDRLVREVQQCL